MVRKRLKREKPYKKFKLGRPSKYDSEVHPRQVLALMKMGYSMVQVASKLNLILSNLMDWSQNHPEFSRALILGNQACETWWIGALRQGMFHPNFKVSAWAMFMGNKFKWRNPKNIQEEEPPKVIHEHRYVLDISNLSDEQLNLLDQLHGLEEKQQLSTQSAKALPARLSEKRKSGKRVKRIY
jgi:hypothetical protein